MTSKVEKKEENSQQSNVQSRTVTIGQWLGEMYEREVEWRNQAGIETTKEENAIDQALLQAPTEKAPQLQLMKKYLMLEALWRNERVENLLWLSTIARAVDGLQSVVETQTKANAFDDPAVRQKLVEEAMNEFKGRVASLLDKVFADSKNKTLWQ